MPISHTVWSLDEKKPLQAASLIDEKELELLLRDNIEILNKGWLVISNQVKTDAGKFIDILCIDHDGDMVVVELKKDLTPREVTAQVIDYAASVSKMTVEEIAQLYLSFTGSNETLNDAFKKKFGTTLDEASVNQNVKMVIVAAKMDDGTERIIRFLRETYRVDINILFFHVFQCGSERLISRTWFEEDIEESAPAEVKKKGPWNGEYYASFGEGPETGRMRESTDLSLQVVEVGTQKLSRSCPPEIGSGSIFLIRDMLVLVSSQSRRSKLRMPSSMLKARR